MQFSVCIDSLFQGQVTTETFTHLKSMGFDYVEWWLNEGRDLDALEASMQATGISCHAFCTPFISLVDPSFQNQYLEELEKTLVISQRFGNPVIISQMGQATEESHEQQLEYLAAGLDRCAPLMQKYERLLVIEPLNTRLDHKGYSVSRSGDAVAVLKLVDSPRIKMLYDIYHQQISEGDILTRLQKYLPWIGHIHAAGVPGRGELDTGELSYRRIFSALEGMGYTQKVGLEYFPKRPPFEGLQMFVQRRET
ncbi:hydroxypyruvate isomerase [Sphaerochaeta pleomorpha str. Grapes]|uniref:Hydroxypyruvate isomerase n=1 Tax=Sphaerochaeta pleomorpha (strain ATCC BAA-1885 / DSM 22778 / Grapes) TaxID=158190 RepID=G8QYC7_SPHPG|nr:TIM barrel protein [Sphaerochaeta pleomorpha]AEV30774.1 hydroxypyruvate isomerase [Sphaerochaeta pleomorpha str. Grapes]